ncbi:MAG: TIGR03560 family F420-dependent LLM class oxidoreductase [Anaerolineales bacterium]|nr:TIGR03560 family F420-dependent LLM class oxidoreductase [Anaerolineales bacterium]
MVEIALMIEGQDGLNWPRWQRLAQAAEDLGFVGLYRSDHYTNARPPDKDSLELWVSLTWLASHTQRIEFGPLVTPVSFRHPSMTARMAAAVDDLSGGRLTLGLGAGWQEREHEKFGWDLLDIDRRFARFEEGIQVIRSLLRSDEPVDFQGEFFHLKEAILLPRPKRPGGPPLLIGGNGPRRTLPLAARYADEWNALFIPPAEFERLNARLGELIREAGRKPENVRRSLMTGCILGRDPQEVERKVAARTRDERSADDLRQRGLLVGTASEILAQLGELSKAGVQRVMLQWLEQDDLDGLQALASVIIG